MIQTRKMKRSSRQVTLAGEVEHQEPAATKDWVPARCSLV